MSQWNEYLLQFLPRSASERAPVEKNTFLLRSATCMMVSEEADEISPSSTTAPSCSIMRCALVEAVAGLTESFEIRAICFPVMPPAAVISSAAIFTPHLAEPPIAPRKPGSGGGG